MNTITVTYAYKYELSFASHYKWLDDGRCFNTKTGRFIRQVLVGGSIGYVINSKFYSLSYLRGKLRKPEINNVPF
jgi:hypothetical protein